MQKISIKLAAPGMALAKPVLRENGMVIVSEGTELTDSLIFRLENMKVEKITVKGNPVDMGGPQGNTAASKRLERLDHLFRHQKDEWMQKVKRFLTRYFKMKAAEQQAGGEGGEGAAPEGNGGEEA